MTNGICSIGFLQLFCFLLVIQKSFSAFIFVLLTVSSDLTTVIPPFVTSGVSTSAYVPQSYSRGPTRNFRLCRSRLPVQLLISWVLSQRNHQHFAECSVHTHVFPVQAQTLPSSSQFNAILVSDCPTVLQVLILFVIYTDKWLLLHKIPVNLKGTFTVRDLGLTCLLFHFFSACPIQYHHHHFSSSGLLSHTIHFRNW